MIAGTFISAGTRSLIYPKPATACPSETFDPFPLEKSETFDPFPLEKSQGLLATRSWAAGYPEEGKALRFLGII
jgi:hypothetical protein